MEYINFAERVMANDTTLSVDEFLNYIALNPEDYEFRFLFSVFLKSRLIRLEDNSNNFEMLKNAIICYVFTKDIAAESLLVEIFRLTGDFNSALLMIDNIIGNYGESAYALYLKGYNLMELKKYEDAVAFFEKSLSIEEESSCRSALNYSLEMLSIRSGV